jgi:hypothetical protein
MQRKNEHYPLYGGYEKELEMPIKPAYGGIVFFLFNKKYEILTETEEREKNKKLLDVFFF